MNRKIFLFLIFIFALVKAFSIQNIYKIIVDNPNDYNITDYQIRIDLSNYSRATTADKVFDAADEYYSFDDGTSQGWVFENTETTGSISITDDNPYEGSYSILIFSRYANSGQYTRFCKNFSSTKRLLITFFASYNGGLSNYKSGSYWIDENRTELWRDDGQSHPYTAYLFTVPSGDHEVCLGLYALASFGPYSTYWYYDSIRVRYLADIDPSVTIDENTGAITITNPNSYDLTDYPVRIPLQQFVFDIKDSNGNSLPFCFEHSDNSCDNVPEDIQAIWVKVPNIPANGQVTLYYYSKVKVCSDLSCSQLLSFCYDHLDKNCNQEPSPTIIVKIPSLNAKSFYVFYIMDTLDNYAKNGEEIFDYYTDFSSNDGWVLLIRRSSGLQGYNATFENKLDLSIRDSDYYTSSAIALEKSFSLHSKNCSYMIEWEGYTYLLGVTSYLETQIEVYSNDIAYELERRAYLPDRNYHPIISNYSVISIGTSGSFTLPFNKSIQKISILLADADWGVYSHAYLRVLRIRKYNENVSITIYRIGETNISIYSPKEDDLYYVNKYNVSFFVDVEDNSGTEILAYTNDSVIFGDIKEDYPLKEYNYTIFQAAGMVDYIEAKYPFFLDYVEIAFPEENYQNPLKVNIEIKYIPKGDPYGIVIYNTPIMNTGPQKIPIKLFLNTGDKISIWIYQTTKMYWLRANRKYENEYFTIDDGTIDHFVFISYINYTVPSILEEDKLIQKTVSSFKKEGNKTFFIFYTSSGTFQNKSIDFSVDLYDENVTYSNYKEFGSSKYAEVLNYTLEVRCGALGYNITVDAWNEKSYTIICDNTTKTISDTWAFNSEGNKAVWFYLNAVDENDSRYFGNDTFIVDLNPPVISNFTTTIHTGFFTNDPHETANFSVYDNISPYVICNYTFVNDHGQINITSNDYNTTEQVNYTPIHGLNNLSLVCYDILNHSTSDFIQKSILLYKIYPIDEETGLYDESLWVDPTTGNMSLVRFIAVDIDQNESFIYENISNKIYLELLGTKEWILQVEQKYSDQSITNTYYLKYAPENIYICMSPDNPNILQIAYSSTPLENRAFAITRSETGCIRAISPTLLIQEGYGFYFYTTAGLYSLWVIYPDEGYENKVLLATFKGDIQTALDLEKSLMLITEIETIPIPFYHNIFIKKVKDQNATLISYKSDKLIKEFRINITKLGEDTPFYTQTLYDSKEIKIELLWSQFGLNETEEIVIDYYAKFEDGTYDKGRIITTPTGRIIKFLWWQAALILMSPMIILFFRNLKPQELFVFAILYIIAAILVLPYSEINIFTQIFGILGVVSLIVVALIVFKVI